MMGIGSNWGVEAAEQECEEAWFEETLREAAILVVEGMDRHSAFARASEISIAQREALSRGEYSEDEETNVIEFFDSTIESSAIPAGKEAQVRAIAIELREQFA